MSEANDSHSSVPTGDDDESSFGFRDKPQACSLKFCDSLSKAAKPPAPESMAGPPPFFNRRIRKNTPTGLSRNYKELHSKDLAKKQKNGGAFAPRTEERSDGTSRGGGRPRPPALGQSRFARPSRHVGSETGRLQPRVSHVLPVPMSEANDSHSSVPTGDDDESSFGFRDKPQACSLKFCDSLSKAAMPPAPESMAAPPPVFNRRIRKNPPQGLVAEL